MLQSQQGLFNCYDRNIIILFIYYLFSQPLLEMYEDIMFSVNHLLEIYEDIMFSVNHLLEIYEHIMFSVGHLLEMNEDIILYFFLETYCISPTNCVRNV